MGLNIAFFGSSLVSAYWNGAATYYRGIIKAMDEFGHKITFYEPDAYNRQQNRDIEDPDWAVVKVYEPTEDAVYKMLADADSADIIIKASGVGVFDELLESAVVDIRKYNQLIVFWDVDAPATLVRIENNQNDPFLSLIPKYDLIFTYGGGEPVVNSYMSNGAKECHPIYNAVDPATHFPVPPETKFKCDLAFLGNRLPDREKRVEHFFLEVAASNPDKNFIIGGSGWHDKPMSKNIKYVGHVFTKDHNAFNCSPKALLNISRDSMAKFGFSPATRVFEAAGAGACIITDYWEGIEYFFEPDKEILIAKDAREVTDYLNSLKQKTANEIGLAAMKKVLAQHTYSHRAKELELLLEGKFNKSTKNG